MNVKQVIVVRRDLKMRRGKEIAQGCHASLGAYEDAIRTDRFDIISAFRIWCGTGQTKICLKINSEMELLNIFYRANESKLPCHLVLDEGRTEFKEPTYTCVAIGPADSEEIDKITGHLELY